MRFESYIAAATSIAERTCVRIPLGALNSYVVILLSVWLNASSMTSRRANSTKHGRQEWTCTRRAQRSVGLSNCDHGTHFKITPGSKNKMTQEKNTTAGEGAGCMPRAFSLQQQQQLHIIHAEEKHQLRVEKWSCRMFNGRLVCYESGMLYPCQTTKQKIKYHIMIWGGGVAIRVPALGRECFRLVPYSTRDQISMPPVETGL